MTPKRIYIILCAVGLVVPYYFFIRFVAEHGFRLPLLISQLFASPISSFFGVDAIIASVVLWVFIYLETCKRPIKLWWVCIVALLAVGVSLALPLFLLLREIEIEKERA